MIRRAKEGEITWLPGLQASDIPQLPKGISLHLKQGELGIEAEGLIGAIPLLNGDTLQIVPKIGRVNFFRLLFKAEGCQRDLDKEYTDFVSYSVDEDQNIDHVVARQLMYSAAEIMKRSPQQGRVKHRREGMYAVGQIDAVSTTLNLACRKQEPVVYFIRERTLSIPENRVLTEAIIRAWLVLEEGDRFELRNIVERWFSRFPRSADLAVDLETIEQGFASGRYGGARDYYRQALMLARIILGSNGLGLSEGAMVEGDAILLNTANIFEKYLRNIISEAYSGAGYVVTKGGVGVTSLYTDGSFELQPDITISKDSRTLLIADAKYKQPTSGDHYQMHTYLAVNGIKRGVILAPLYEGTEVVVREYSTSDKTLVREIYLPMGDLNLTEQFLGTLIEFSS
jgi:5-methylcytosine-specific restriction endonuclease McrBC regulatory subunit McrC